ncbi:MAG TPA: hypothetical protein VMP42_03215 [Actinomycetota bacterium]|nr:hypothetical protein [Actinomycetota bacterium]
MAAEVERAKDALVAAVPASRREPEPLAASILGFEERLGAALRELEAWEGAPPDLHERCRTAIEEAARRSESLRLQAPSLEFEGLVLVLGDVIAPLDALGDVEHELARRA